MPNKTAFSFIETATARITRSDDGIILAEELSSRVILLSKAAKRLDEIMEVVIAHGLVRVESKPGEGSTFYIAFSRIQKEGNK